MDWIKEIENQDISDKIMSFESYMELVQKNARKECRPNCIYLKDMFDYYGRDQDGSFKLFKHETPQSPAVQGQELTQEFIYRSISNFVEEGSNHKFVLLVGPNGSSKSSLVKKIMLSAEKYSQTTEGSLYTFSWIFPLDNITKGNLGFSKKDEKKQKIETYAFLEEKNISAVMPSDLKDHPLMLIPLEQRRNIIDELFKNNDVDYWNSIKKSYLYNGELSKRNKSIFDAMLKRYNGNYLEVYKHIKIEKFDINRTLSESAVTIEPQMHVDARIQQITMDKRLASLPPSLQSLNLFSLSGEVVMANRGILEFSDLLKRPLDAFKYLLTTMENKSVNLNGIISDLDIFFIGTSNELHLAAFKKHPDFNSFRGRFNFIRVPYLLDFKKERRIYTEQIENLRDRCYFEQHSLEALCLWATMTRIRKPIGQAGYAEPKTGALAARLNPIEKVLFLTLNLLPESFNLEEKQRLMNNKDELKREFINELDYEGKFGISPRDIKQVIYDLASEHQNITFIEIIEYLKNFSKKKTEFDFLNIAPQGDYHNYDKLITYVEEYTLSLFDSEVRESLGLVDDRSYEEYITKYVHQVLALIKKEKIKNPVTGKYEESDMFLIKEFETNIQLKDKPDIFRSHIISRLGAYSIDNPGKKIVYTEVFQDLVKLLRQSFREEQKKVINRIGENLVYYKSDKKINLNKDVAKEIDSVINNLTKRFYYREETALKMLQYLIKNRY